MKSILIVAGESSGDKYGADVVQEFKKRHADAVFFGLGGDRLAGQGVELRGSLEELNVVGIFEVFGRLPRIRRAFRRLERESLVRNPAAALLIDSPDFNLRLAKRLSRAGIPVVYYISPTVWAWRPGRLKTIRKVVARMCLIFPFEKQIYAERGIPAEFVGHPLKDKVQARLSRRDFRAGHSLPAEGRLVTLLPGSRRSEIRNHVPVLVEAVRRLRADPGVHFLLVLAETVDRDYLHRFLPRDEPGVRVLSEDGYDAIAHSDLVLSACGTATLETALLGTPLIAYYRLSPLTYYPFRRLIRVRSYSIVNILAGREIVPELIQRRFNAAELAREARALLLSEERRTAMRDEFRRISRLLGEGKAAEGVARELEKIVFPLRP
jgi:lipid-A-disaccharide synthase